MYVALMGFILARGDVRSLQSSSTLGRGGAMIGVERAVTSCSELGKRREYYFADGIKMVNDRKAASTDCRDDGLDLKAEISFICKWRK